MASWMVHLRTADKLLEYLPDVFAEEFIMGNIAPDSGVPNKDWSTYTPASEVSHYKTRGAGGRSVIQTDKYVDEYFTNEKQSTYTKKQYSFYLGYLTHLLTDVLWMDNVYNKSREAYPDKVAQDEYSFLWELKKDWYDLDFLYLKKHPEFKAFQIYQGLVGFHNCYMDIFAEDAFDNRREYITGFYLAGRENVEREYKYFTEQQAEKFVQESYKIILKQLQKYI